MPAAPDLSAVLRQPFAEQAAFFRGKLGNLVPTAKWDDLWKSQHDRAFMVAGAAKADLLADLAEAVDEAIADGDTLDKFRQRFGEIVQKHGWHGWTGEDSKAGRAWRTRIIYQTNLATSYAAGRLAQLRQAGFKYWVYKHSGAEHPRLQHKAWHGLTLPADHPFWQAHYPPNGWGCGCRVVGANGPAGAKLLGGDPSYDTPPPGWDAIDRRTGEPPGIDKGWGYMPGATAADRLHGLVPRMADNPPAGRPVLPPICPDSGAHAKGECPGPLPRPRPFDPGLLLPDGKPERYYIDAFLEVFGLRFGEDKIIEDVTGERLVIGTSLFIDRAKSARKGEPVYKVFKDGIRRRHMRMLAETILHPQEIWEQWEWIAAREWMGAREAMALRRRYIALWDVGGRDRPALSVFEFSPKRWWTGVTTFVPRDRPTMTADEYIAQQRTGKRRWPK
ncbi:PBECR2 nuclease fold domain-containing protein [Hydrogenophilus thermoluteolus]|uniref:PBECR2 nuclease fold domain-containing protein n=1 Tax=Hydrogenophilus thermoluteolus TaxID=297 RepID=UPI003F673B8A